MQRTRINTLFSQIILRFRQWVFNPWRRLSVIFISLLFGNLFATAISAISGQSGKPDILASAALVLGVELISWLYYRFTPRQQRERMNQSLLTAQTAIVPTDIDTGPVRSRSTLAESLNAFKLGLTYGLFVEAFKLGS